jgi:hypothetical protein
MKHYWCFLCVRFQKPKLIRVGGRAETLRAKGYWRRMGVTVRTGADLRSVIKRTCEDGSISWRRSELERIRSYDLGEAGVREVWYRGGRVYFTQ